ncbi:hypothetical protein V5799_029429 [Amblyomma americanum]|uniref:Uncharacterized protein n=1 Tax=Amblyomma americanum TaxID=6943 RepID=A0AAQ4ER18_AMBAM
MAKFERNNTDLLMSLRVACVNRRNGCRLLDTLRGMKEHLKQCEFQAVQCQMCGKKIKLHEVPGHARKDCSRIPKGDGSKRVAVPASQAGPPTRAATLQKPTGEQPMAMGAMQSPTLQTVPPPGMPPQMVMQPVPMAQHQMMAQHVQAAQQPPVLMQQGPRFEEVAMLQQKVNKVSEEVRKMAAKMQAMKDETARDLEVIKKDVQKLRNEKGDHSVLVNAISGLRSQMKADMADVTEEFDAIKDDMRIYGATIEDLATLKDTMDQRIGDVVMNVESLKESMEGYSMLSTTVAEMKSSIVAIQDMKHVMEFVNDFEETLLGDITGSSGDKKKAFTQQVEMLKKCVEVIDELKSTVKHKDMEQVVNDLTTIKHDLDKYSALHDKVDGIMSDLATMKTVMKDAGDLAKGDNARIEEYRTDLGKCDAEIKLLRETMQKTDDIIAQLKTKVEDTKEQNEFTKMAAEILALKTKLEDYDLVRESLQLTKDAVKRIDLLSEDLNKIREKMLELEKSETKSSDSDKKMDDITTQLSNLQATNDDIRRLQVSLQTLNKRFNRKTEELQASFEAAISEKIEASKKPNELAELQASLTEVKKDVQLLSELKESLSGKNTANKGTLEDAVKDLKELKASMQALQESSTSVREKMKCYDELQKSVDAIKEDMKDYQKFKTTFDSLRKAVDEKLTTAEDKD